MHLILSVLEWRLFWKAVTDLNPQQWHENCFLPHPEIWISWAYRHALTPMLSHIEGTCLSSRLILLGNWVLHRRETKSYVTGRNWRWSGPAQCSEYSRPSWGGRTGHFAHSSEHLNPSPSGIKCLLSPGQRQFYSHPLFSLSPPVAALCDLN